MRAKTECELSVNSIDLVQSKLEILADDINIAPNEIIKKLLNEGEKYAQDKYNSYQYRNSKEECTIMKTDIGSDDLSGEVKLVGRSAFYEEFGTGERGKSNPYDSEIRAKLKLKDYNSGPYVSTHKRTKSGKHYWFYGPMAGEKGYLKSGLTYGIPSGKMMYQTGKHLHKESKKLVKEQGERIVSKFNK